MKVLIFVLLLSVFLTPVTARPCDTEDGEIFGCLNCDEQNPYSCNMCSEGLLLNIFEGQGYCVPCPIGTGKAADQVPQTESTTCDVTCDDECDYCGANHRCLICKAGYYMTFKDRKCTLCDGGKGSTSSDNEDFQVDTACRVTCPTGCNTCISQTQCVACKAGYRFIEASKTCTRCTEGTGRGADTSIQTSSTTCGVSCNEGCKWCGSAGDKCLACNIGYEFDSQTGSCTKCPTGFTAPATNILTYASTKCVACDSKCAKCFGSSNICLGCAAGHFFDAELSTCTPCEAGKGRGADLSTPIESTTCTTTCQSPCTFCGQNPTDCLGCEVHHQLNLAGQQCIPCPAGKTRAADTAIQTKDTTCGISCSPSCSLCSGTANNCQGCKAGHSFNFDNKSCSSCPAGSGNPADNTPKVALSQCDVITCDASCLTCGASADECLSCPADKRLDWATKKCVACDRPGYTRAADTQSQVAGTICDLKCAEGCTFCSGTATNCLGCAAGFRYDFDAKTCNSCPGYKGNAADLAPRTDRSDCFVFCDSTCALCGATGTECTGCPAGFRLSILEKKCLPCSGSTGRARDTRSHATDTICNVDCVRGCDRCTDSPTECLRCDQGFYKRVDGECWQCPTGRGKPRDIEEVVGTDDEIAGCPLECNPECVNCKGNGPSDCLGCRGAYQTDYDKGFGICKPCTNRQYGFDRASYTKVQVMECGYACHATCDKCQGADANDCLSCRSGYYWTGDGTCSICELGTGKPKDTEVQTVALTATACSACHPSCLRCSGPLATDCLTCNAGYLRSSAGTCNKCESGKTKTADVDVTAGSTCNINCDSKCTSCSGSNLADCLTCKHGFYMKSGFGCEFCPVGSGKFNDPNQPTMVGTESSCDLVCHPSCANCWGPESNQCTRCRGGYFWSGNGKCTSCPVGKGLATGDQNMAGTNAQLVTLCNAISCHASCKICSASNDATKCSLCAAGYYMTQGGLCEPCPIGKGKEADTEFTIGVEACEITCNSECGTCYGPEVSSCLSCRAGKYLSATGTCTACTAGNGKPDDPAPVASPTTSVLACTKTCHKSCATCSGNTANECLLCSAGYIRSGATTCSLCPAGTGSAATQGDNECTITCHSTCSVCKDNTSSGCLTCKAGYSFALPGACTLCPDNKGFATRTEQITANDGPCTDCNANCLTCGEQTTQCLRCHAGKYLKPDRTCDYCSSGTGKGADSGIISPSADNGASECSPCHPSCNICSGPSASNCLSCAQDYFWTGSTALCQACDTKKHKAKDLNIKFGSNTADSCPITCSNECVKCESSSSFCLTCDAGYYLFAAGKCFLCGASRGKAADTGIVSAGTETERCIDCHHSCDKCSGSASNQCLHCAAGHYLSAAGVCTLCRFGKGNAVAAFTAGSPWGTPVNDNGNAACGLDCHAECSSCSVANDSTKCVGCAAGRYFKTDGSCAQCEVGFGKPADTSAPTPVASSSEGCTRCHASCALCKGPNANDCLLCAAGHYLSAANTCSLCTGRYGKAADPTAPASPSATGTDMCTTPCHNSCDSCSGTAANQCVTCAKGFFWNGDGTCSKCGEGTGKAAGTEVKTTAETSEDCLVTCDPACQVCFDNTSAGCIMCSAGYFYSAEHTCTICPSRKGKLKDTNYPATVTSDTTSPPECGIDCHPTCRTCSGTGATECLNCAAGFYLSAPGICTGCPANQGKPADSRTYKTAQPVTSCSNCHRNCNKCKGSGATDCLNCNDGLYLSAAGTCSACPLGSGAAKAPPSTSEYPEPNNTGDSTVCPITCAYPCITCKDNTVTGCLSCDAGHFLSAAGTCTTCAPGRGKAADPAGVSEITNSDTACDKTCSGGCGLCSSDTDVTCLSCLAGFYRSGANSCTSCGIARGGPGSPLKGEITTETAGCTNCHSSCEGCSGPAATDCLDCSAGFFLSALGTCDLCPFGFGKLGKQGNPRSTTQGTAECTIQCSANCRSCSGTNSYNCIGCRAGHFNNDSECDACPVSRGKPTDSAATIPIRDQTSDDCTIPCHYSCKTCGGPTANDCTSCAAGHWWSGQGNGVLGKCEACPKSRGKDADVFLFTNIKGSPNECTTYCDLCEAGCLTCSSNPSECALCIDTKYLTPEKTCADCPENCLKCSDATKCDTCDADYELTTDGKSCLKCQVLNCETCTDDPFKCTKCADKFTLKSDTECVYEPKQQPLALNLSTVSVAETPQLALNILENTLELPFSARESQNFVAITMEDASDSKVYSCAELRCAYSIKNQKLRFEFNTDITIKKGKLKIDRGADAKKTSIVESSSHRNSRLLQELANYPIVIDGISLMKQSRLSTAAFATRVIVGIFRLPLSLLVFWKFPHLAMMMDHMVTHLKVYSLMSQPYMAYVEVVFQSVSDSKILPFNFDNPFENWNSNTLDCEGFVGLRSKNMHCSFFDNYGENIIGIASVILTCVILVILSKKMLQNTNMTSSPRNFWGTISRYYGLHFMISKIDANHLEIALMTLIAYATADHSSKSVIGIIFGTVVLIAFGFIARHVTNAARRVYQSTTPAAAQTNSVSKSSTEQALNPVESESDIALDNEIATFVLSQSTTPSNKWSVYFFTARYIRALLLVIFVATVRDPVDQIVLVVILEAVYLVALFLLDFRGSKLERFFHIGMHGIILAHLICRAIATSKTLSLDALQSSLATAIVVFLMIYVFAHVVACIFVLICIFMKNSTKQTTSPVNVGSTKIEMTEGPKPQEAYQELPIPQEPVKDYNPSSPISYIDMPVAPEVFADGRGPSVHNGNQASMQQYPNQSPISYMELPVPPEMNGTVRGDSAYNGRQALIEKNTNRPQPSFVDIDIPQE